MFSIFIEETLLGIKIMFYFAVPLKVSLLYSFLKRKEGEFEKSHSKRSKGISY
jgi:hypothetical protein